MRGVRNISETLGSIGPSVGASDPEPDAYKCRNCGREADPDADSCPNCASKNLRPLFL